MNAAAVPRSRAISHADPTAAGPYRPATFLQRGLALPFTTPHLLGGRIRPGDRGTMELVLVNPAGREGVYVQPWSALLDICTPTLHDRELWDRVGGLGLLVPRSLRAMARRVAIAGFAGRAAARAAESALAEDARARTATHYHLLLALVRQGESAAAAGPPPEAESPPRLEQRARAVLAALEPGQPASALAAFEALAELAEAFQLCGLKGNPTLAAMPALIAEIGAVAQDVGALAGALPEAAPERQGARLIARGARLTLRCCRPAMTEALAPLDDLPGLLRQWRRGRAETVRERTARLEWLLDGWGMICGLWRTAHASRRRVAVLEMAMLLPLLPAEAEAWLRLDPDPETGDLYDSLNSLRRVMQPNQDWLTGRILELVAQNERLRASRA